jgi:hypothetical protein
LLEEPTDFIGVIISTLLGKRYPGEALAERIGGWRMTVVLETDYYPLAFAFSNGLTLRKGNIDHPTLRVVSSFDTIVEIARGSISPFSAFLKRSVKIRGLIQHPISSFRFIRLLLSALRGA